MIKYTLKSKTHIWGTLMGIAGGVAVFLPQIEDMLPPDAYKWAFIISGLVVIVLRNVTTTPISQK